MNDLKTIQDIRELSTCITDTDFYLGLNEIIEKLENIYSNYDLHCMNDGVIGLYGEKRMLGAIIEYLKKI